MTSPEKPIEDQFASDHQHSRQDRAGQQLRILRYTGFLVGLYGLLLKTVVPICLGVVRSETAAQMFQDMTLTWIPVLGSAWILGRRRPVTFRLAAFLISGGLVFYAVGLPTFLLNLPSDANYAIFSHIYYSVMCEAYFVAAAFVLSRGEVRNLFGPRPLLNIPAMAAMACAALVASSSAVLVFQLLDAPAGEEAAAAGPQVLLEGEQEGFRARLTTTSNLRELIPIEFQLEMTDPNGRMVRTDRLRLSVQPGGRRRGIVAAESLKLRVFSRVIQATHHFRSPGPYELTLQAKRADESPLEWTASLEVAEQVWLPFSTEFGFFGVGVLAMAGLAFGGAAWIRRRASRPASEPPGQSRQ